MAAAIVTTMSMNCMGRLPSVSWAQRPIRSRAADKQRDQGAPFHCPIPPVLPTKRIAHLSTSGDCCAAGFRSGLCPLWVISRPHAVHRLGPLCPSKRTYISIRLDDLRSENDQRLSEIGVGVDQNERCSKADQECCADFQNQVDAC